MGEDRLAGTCLAGDRVEAGTEAKLGPVDQEKVFDPDFEQHTPRSNGGRRRISPFVGEILPGRCNRSAREPTELVADALIEAGTLELGEHPHSVAKVNLHLRSRG